MSDQPLPPQKLEQSRYIVAHLDFLGASEKMKSVEEKDSFLQQIYKIYHGIKKAMEAAPSYGRPILDIRIFSDNILFAHKVQFSKTLFEEWQYVSRWTSMLQAFALQHELLIRGAITIGDFYIDDVFVYGEALAKAYEMESKRAMYPRIIVDHNFFKNTLFTGEIRTVKENTFFKDTDGEWCVNFIGSIITDPENSLRFLTEIRTAISKMYAENKNNLRVKQKYYWLINKFNELVKKAGYEQCAIPSTIYDEPDTTTVILKRGKA